MYGIRIIGVNGQAYRHRVTRELASALKSRRRSEDRILWLEVICTNQEDYEERNRQVQMTASIYNSAFQVCVWLGQDNGNFEPAVIFIQEIMQMGSFDSISNDKGSSSKKLSLLQLMQRPWFSTHRAIQDIALVRQATLYCGWEELSWEHLAVAIEFLLEEEAVTHCQSKITTTQEVSKYVSPISTFGASILVQATPNTFHRNVEGTHNLHTPVQNIPRTRKSRTRKKKGNPSMRHLEVAPSVYSPPRPLLSLEHLVSRFSAFKSPHPMDAIYSFLAISKDTSPLAEDFEVHDNSMEALMSKIFSLLRHTSFSVNYAQSYSDFCTGFVAHCVERAKNMDAARALDILCRPWAPLEPPPTMSSYKKSTRYKYLKNRIPLGKRRGTKMRKITVSMPSDSEDEGGPYKEVEDNRPLAVYFRDAPQPPEDWLQRINTALCKELTPPPSYDSEDEESSDFYDDSERDDDDSVLGYDRAEERSLALP